jgi:hypothetical protein
MYYTGTAKYQKEDEHGRLKLATEQYLVDAVSFTEAEAKLYQFLGDSIRGEFKVKSISESGITDVFDFEDGGIYYQSTVAYFVAEESGKEKMIKNKMLIEAKNITQAIERTRESLSNMLVSFDIPECKESKIIEVIQYEREEEGKEVHNDTK